MKVFPSKGVEFTFAETEDLLIRRLDRSIEKSETLTSRNTSRPFIGKLTENHFEIISSAVGIGSFCIMNGEVLPNKLFVNVEIQKVFKILLGIFLCLPVVGLPMAIITSEEEFSFLILTVIIGQVLMIRFLFIGVAFKLISKISLNRMRYVLELEELD